MTTIRLIAKGQTLYFPMGGRNADFEEQKELPAVLVRSYPAGDFDTIPWPIPKRRKQQCLNSLARALFDERETNPFYPSGPVTIELPDGTVFDFDAHLEA